MTDSLPPIGPQVQILLDTLTRGIGIGNLCTLTWDRSGAGSFDLIGGQPDQWTTERIYGKLGRFSMRCATPAVPIVDPFLEYHVSGDDLTVLAGCSLPGFAKHLSPAHAQVVGAAVGAGQPVGIGILTVFSVLSLVWTLLHPRLTLNLPGTMECTLLLDGNGGLTVGFLTPPTMTAVFGVQFTITPNSLYLTPRTAVVQYKAGWFSQTKQWSW